MRAAASPRAHGGRNAGRALLIALALVVAAVTLVLPLALIFVAAFADGLGGYVRNITAPDTLHAIFLTVLTAVIVVPVNIVFGVATAWAVARYEFPGRKLMISLIEIPFSVSPIVAGTIYLFLYGQQGLLGPTLQSWGIQVMFSVPAIVLVSLFVTAPFVARELIPLMQAQGSDDEEAALSLGASPWQTFRHVTLPNVRWALLYGALLTNARSMGEFGAVSVVSGAIRGQTNTLPLQIEQLYNDFNIAGAFAAASTLALLAVATLGIKYLMEAREA
jgi:sulfate transport system permease protein